METENTFSDNDKFITIMQSNSPTWDKRNEAYALKNEREKAWRNVLHAMYGEQGSKVWNDEKILKTGWFIGYIIWNLRIYVSTN